MTYGGGCGQHGFALEWDGDFEESNPVQADLVLVHDAHGDMCRALLADTLEFDLTPLKQDWREGYARQHGTIILNVEGASGSVDYTF